MTTERRHLVFVDDDPWEVKRFRELYHGDRFRVTAVAARHRSAAITRVKEEVHDQRIDLFVLDLFFPEVDHPPDQISADTRRLARAMTEEIAARARRLEDHFGNSADLLRESHALMYRAAKLLDSLCIALRQSPAGGIALLKDLDAEYPRVPKVFYSRKATLADAKTAFEAGALDVLSKPDPTVEQDEAQAIMKQFEDFSARRAPGWCRSQLGQLVKWGIELGPAAIALARTRRGEGGGDPPAK